jgi:hypothetical protein
MASRCCGRSVAARRLCGELVALAVDLAQRHLVRRPLVAAQ